MLANLALVTGASSGLGKILSRKLAELGIPLLITGRDQKRLEDVHSSLSKKTAIESLTLDLADEKDRKKLISIIKKKAPDLVINAAGFGLYGHILEYTTDEEMKLLELNANAPIEISIEAARALYAQKKKGTILNISSVAGFYTFPTLSMYAVSKGALTHFSKCFDYEMKTYGIRVLVSCPGQIDTDFIYRAGGKKTHPRKLAMKAEYAAERILQQIEKQKTVEVFDWRYRLSLLSRLFPKKILLRRLVREIEKRYERKKFLTE